MIRFRPLWLCLFTLGALVAGRPGYALPKFAREYGVGCESCHSVPPRLNAFGLAFQANHFNWPGGSPPAAGNALKAALPSATVTFRSVDDRTHSRSSTQFEELQLFFAGGFRAGMQRPGGYMASLMVATREEKAGNMEEAFASVPVAGRRGQLAFTAGQSSPLMYQWWHHTRLISTSPAALTLGSAGGEAAMGDGTMPGDHGSVPHTAHADGSGHEAEAFSFGDHSPSLRLDYFSGRGNGTADGQYVTIGVPFAGQLALNREVKIGASQGLFGHAFQRWGPNTLGAFAYTHGGEHLEGLIGTRDLTPKLSLLGIGSLGENDMGAIRRLALEGEYLVSPRLALTARLEALGGAESDLGSIAALTFYPLKQRALRMTLQSNQQKGNRSLELWARGQF
jgi:hypothetical protein